MDKMPIREAKASFSALVDAAKKGKPTLITRHGEPAAVIVPVEAGRRLFPLDTLNLGSYLLDIPEPLQTERDTTSLRDFDL